MYVPYVKQEEPLKLECQHFLDCIQEQRKPLTSGERGLEVVRILELASAALKLKTSHRRPAESDLRAPTMPYPIATPVFDPRAPVTA